MNLTINGRQVTVDDSFRDLSREDQEATVAHIADSMPADAKPAAEPSGVAAGVVQGVKDNIHGVAETAKQVGIGGGKDFAPDNYVPANVTNGSINPLKWNWSQVPQKIAESAPGLAQDAVAGALAKAALGKVPYVGKAAPLIGAGLDAFLRTGGDTVNQVAAQHGNAEPTLTDKLQGLGTAAASSAVGSVAPTRFVPGGGAVPSTMLQAAKKYLATTAIGSASSAASDAVNQLGTKGSIDPSQSIEAAAGGGLTAGALAAPRGLADTVSSARHADMYSPANAQATAAYNNRLVQNAGQAGLGNSRGDYAAQENTKAGLKKELQQVDASGMNQDTQNALSLATSGKPLTNDHVSSIEAADPEAGFLARQLRMAQQNEKFGSYDNANKAWSGGLSGLADKYAVRPFKSHLLIGGGSAILGAHMLGSYSLPTLGAAATAYGLARGVDNLTGARSPAAASATRFADANVPTRLAPPPAQPAPQAPPPAASPAPWGPRPNPTGPSGPQVAPPAAPQPQAPPLNPVALNMLKQTLKQNPHAQAPSPQAAPPPAPTPEQQVQAQISPIALASLKMRMKENQAAADEASKQQNADYKANVNQAFSENRTVNKDFGANQNQAVSENKARDKADAEEAKAEAAEAKSQAKLAAAAARTTITKKAGGEVKVNAPSPQAAPSATADPYAHAGDYTPVPDEALAFKGMDPKQIAQASMSKYEGLPQLSKQAIFNSIVGTRTARNNAIGALTAQHPGDAGALEQLRMQLHQPGHSNKDTSMRAVKHYAGLMSPEGGKATLEHFARKDVQDTIWPARKRKTNAKRAEGATAS